MDFVPDNTVNKLILLYVLDKMEIPLTENSILEICSSQNGFDYEGAYNNREDPFGAWGRYFGDHAFITEGNLTIEIYMHAYLEIQHGMFGEYIDNGFIIDRGAFDEGLITFVPYENDESYQ